MSEGQDQSENNNGDDASDSSENASEMSSEDGELILPSEVEDIIKELPEIKQKALKAVIKISIQKSWRGPLPSPESLKLYNEAVPDAAERILKMAENQALHRQSIEKIAIPGQLKESRLGQLFGFTLAALFLFVSGFLIYDGHETAGTILGTVDLVALVSVFVFGKKYSQGQE